MIAEWRPDPDQPNALLRGKRVQDSLRKMHETGRLSDSEWRAIEQFRDDWAMIAGGGLGLMQCAPRQGGGSSSGWLPGDAILAATRRIRETQAKMDVLLRHLAVLLIVDGYSMADAGKRIRRAKQRVAEDFRRILVLLAEAYGHRRIASQH